MPGGYLPVTEGAAGCPGLYDPGLSRNCGSYGVGDAGRAGKYEIYYKERRIAKKLYEKNVFFGRFLMAMGIEKEIARRDAMGVKNVLSDESYERLREFAKERELI